MLDLNSELQVSFVVDLAAYFVGTRAQLIAEGLALADGRWPEGHDTLKWRRGALQFALERRRPPGVRGRKSAWRDVDYWCLTVTMPEHDYQWREARAVEREISMHETSARRLRRKFTREELAHIWNHTAARADTQFQGLVERLVRPRTFRSSAPKDRCSADAEPPAGAVE
ncbi:MAG: hypothetical protein ACTHL8_23275 [Burkholderiaceae bacterium]